MHMGERAEGRGVNRLAGETSPYLLQHADNPVDWYPWGPEAMERARTEDKPILLSVGYAACHWCHVMAHESFEDPDTAALMNEHFVSVKGDREERPDVDAIYMSAVQAMTGQGGWPMTVMLTPEGEPFFAGTYFPSSDRLGMPSFRKVLLAVADAWRDRREDARQQGRQVAQHIAMQTGALAGAAGELDEGVLRQALEGIGQGFDPRWGGFAAAPKFPQPMTLEFLLRCHLRGWPKALEMVQLTLDRMAAGGTCAIETAGSSPRRTPTPRAWRASSSCGRSRSCRRWLASWWPAGSAPSRRATGRASTCCGPRCRPRRWRSGRGSLSRSWRRRCAPATKSCSSTVRRAASTRPPTTRCWPPGTAWRSPRWPRPAGCSRSPPTSKRRRPAPSSCSAACGHPAGGCPGRGGKGASAARATSTTTPAWRRPA